MKLPAIVGIILIIIGIIAFAWGGIGWSERKKDAQLGPLEITHTEEHKFPLPPLLGGICVVGGIVLLVAGSRGASA